MEKLGLFYMIFVAVSFLISIVYAKDILETKKDKMIYFFITFIVGIGTMGVFWAKDFLTLFIFFEIMSIASYGWVITSKEKEAKEDANTYLAYSILGGLVILMGLFLLYDLTKTLEFLGIEQALTMVENKSRLYSSIGCLLFGFGMKGGLVPLHSWLPKAYTTSYAPASALFASCLTKTGVYSVLLVWVYIVKEDLYWNKILLAIAVLTMILGGIMALCTDNIKKVLSYSSVSQMGFIAMGIALVGLFLQEHEHVLTGTIAYMMNHSIVKVLLFFIVGIIYKSTNTLNLNELKGCGRNNVFLKITFVIAALGISGIPLFNGYVGKTLLHESIKAYSRPIEILFLICGGMTVAYMVKIYMILFVGKSETSKKIQLKPLQIIIISLITLCIPISSVLMGKMSYYHFDELLGSVYSVLIGFVFYILVVRNSKNINRWPKFLNIEDNIYKPILLKILPISFGIVCRIMDRFVDRFVVFFRKTIYHDAPIPHEQEEGNEFTHIIGVILNMGIRIMNHSIWMDRRKEENMEHKLALIYDEFSESNTIISRSLSFALFTTSFGLLLVLSYMIYRAMKF
ncbi:MAG: complex I subunit 5 family protein [Lachnospiraceae bacterium]